jgi:hypothetical protein
VSVYITKEAVAYFEALVNFHEITHRQNKKKIYIKKKNGDLHEMVKRGTRREDEGDEKFTECVQDKDTRAYVYSYIARNRTALGEPLVLGQPVL